MTYFSDLYRIANAYIKRDMVTEDQSVKLFHLLGCHLNEKLYARRVSFLVRHHWFLSHLLWRRMPTTVNGF